jgi:hypothetical protein
VHQIRNRFFPGGDIAVRGNGVEIVVIAESRFVAVFRIGRLRLVAPRRRRLLRRAERIVVRTGRRTWTASFIAVATRSASTPPTSPATTTISLFAFLTFRACFRCGAFLCFLIDCSAEFVSVTSIGGGLRFASHRRAGRLPFRSLGTAPAASTAAALTAARFSFVAFGCRLRVGFGLSRYFSEAELGTEIVIVFN